MTASEHPRWRPGSKLTSHGYMKVRVGPSHPLGDSNGYAYEHLVVWVSSGRRAPKKGHCLHHRNGDKTDNRIGNLAIMKSGEHSRQHGITRAKTQRRDADGRFGCGV